MRSHDTDPASTSEETLAVLDDQRYTEISARLRAEGFEPDQNAAGNPTVQRWRLGELKVDFLMPPAPGQDPTRRVQNLEPDFGALVTRGLELAFNEREQVTIVGRTLAGEKAMREVPVCGLGGLPSVMGAVPAWRVVRPGSCVGPGDALPSGGSRVAKRVNRVTIRARRSCRHRQARRRAFWVSSGCTK